MCACHVKHVEICGYFRSPSTMWIPRIKHRSSIRPGDKPYPLIHLTGSGSRAERWELGYGREGTIFCPEVDTVTQPKDMSPGLRGRREEIQGLIRENFPSCVSWLKTTGLQS